MFRDIATIIVGVNALAVLFGFGIRRLRRERQLTHREYVKQLREENDELDRELERLKGS